MCCWITEYCSFGLLAVVDLLCVCRMHGFSAPMHPLQLISVFSAHASSTHLLNPSIQELAGHRRHQRSRGAVGSEYDRHEKNRCVAMNSWISFCGDQRCQRLDATNRYNSKRPSNLFSPSADYHEHRICPLAARIISEHTRTVNRVQFHSTEPTLLLSGSQDGTMKMWVCHNEWNHPRCGKT